MTPLELAELYAKTKAQGLKEATLRMPKPDGLFYRKSQQVKTSFGLCRWSEYSQTEIIIFVPLEKIDRLIKKNIELSKQRGMRTWD